MSSWQEQIAWLTADWHFGDPRLDLLCRPFSSPQEHDELLIRNFNQFVEPDDVVLVVGDVTSRYSPEKLELVSEMHGQKVLIRGNHDEPHSDVDLGQFFIDVVGHGDGLEFEHDGIALYATHYPTRGVEDRFNIVGHVHGAWRCQLNMLNVGVDCFGFFPCPHS